MKYSEKWGDNIEMAKGLALEELGIEEDEAIVTVLEEPSKGFFGLGAKLALVRVEQKQVAPEKKQPKTREKSIKPAIQRREKNRNHNEYNGEFDESKLVYPKEFIGTKPENLMPVENRKEVAFVEDLMKNMDLNVSVKGYSFGDNSIYVDINGEDARIVVGKRGSVLDHIQYLANLYLNSLDDRAKNIVIDVDGYREKHEKRLIAHANKVAQRAIRENASIKLGEMNPFERKVIHSTVDAIDGVMSYSTGYGQERRVVIKSENAE